jgi:hypothetical protein
MVTRLRTWGRYHERRGSSWTVRIFFDGFTIYRRNSFVVEFLNRGHIKRFTTIDRRQSSGHWWHYC